MNNFWSRHLWLRRSTSGMLAFLVVVIAALLSIAYVYMLPEDRTERPAYLTYLQDIISMAMSMPSRKISQSR